MFRLVSNFTWIFLGVGIFFLMDDPLRANHTFYNYFLVALKIYLFIISAYLVLKRVIFYRLKGEINIISLIKKSDYQLNLIAQGGVLILLGLAFVQSYGNLKSVDSIVIILLGVFYYFQIRLNSNPTIYLDDNSFSYDDYFIDKWQWKDLARIDFGEEKLKLITPRKNFELDFNLVDEIDYQRITSEVDHNILDGEFGRDKTSKSLIEIIESYAAHNDVPRRTTDG